MDKALALFFNRSMQEGAINNVIQQLKELHHGKPWIGSSFVKKLNQVDEEHVFVRPVEGMNSVAQILNHLTLWRKEAILKIKTGRGSKTDDCEENWMSNEDLKAIGWKELRSAYDNSFNELIELLSSKEDGFLDQEYYDTDFKGDYSYRWLLNGMVEHDAYHLGQLGIVVKFLLRQ